MSTSGLEINDKKIAAALRTMRERWGEGFANPHGQPSEPSWVSNYSHVNKANRCSHANILPKAKHASVLPPRSGKPGGAMVQRAPGLRAQAAAISSARQRPGEKEHPTARE
jgi:hypothetical protein